MKNPAAANSAGSQPHQIISKGYQNAASSTTGAARGQGGVSNGRPDDVGQGQLFST